MHGIELTFQPHSEFCIAGHDEHAAGWHKPAFLPSLEGAADADGAT